jgi:hypothetical protein
MQPVDLRTIRREATCGSLLLTRADKPASLVRSGVMPVEERLAVVGAGTVGNGIAHGMAPALGETFAATRAAAQTVQALKSVTSVLLSG